MKKIFIFPPNSLILADLVERFGHRPLMLQSEIRKRIINPDIDSPPFNITEKDYDNPELTPLLDRLMIGPGINAKDRIQLMKLVWDVTGTEFASRQSLYERLYAGDPGKNREIWFHARKRTESENMVRRLLGWPDV